jgi:hypothetical protein
LLSGLVRGRFETQIRGSQRSEADDLSEAVRIWDLRFVAALYQACEIQFINKLFDVAA